MRIISEAQIKDVLGNYEEKYKIIRKRIKAIQDEIINTDSILQSVSMKKITLDSDGGGGKHKDLLDAMLMHQQLERQHSMELITEMHRLIEEEESINRILVCFRALRGKEYTYIQQLYVCKEAYKKVELESGYSHSHFETIRAKGMKQIQTLYESDMSNVQISKSAKMGKYSGKSVESRKRESGCAEYEQLTLKL